VRFPPNLTFSPGQPLALDHARVLSAAISPGVFPSSDRASAPPVRHEQLHHRQVSLGPPRHAIGTNPRSCLAFRVPLPPSEQSHKSQHPASRAANLSMHAVTFCAFARRWRFASAPILQRNSTSRDGPKTRQSHREKSVRGANAFPHHTCVSFHQLPCALQIPRRAFSNPSSFRALNARKHLPFPRVP